MPRGTVLLISVTMALAIAACDSDRPSPSVETPAGPSATAAGDERPSGSAAAADIVPGCEARTDDVPRGLTGVWNADDDGLYYLHETGDHCLWWFGTDVGRTTGRTFANIAVGRIEGNVIRLEWADVPYGHWLNGGLLTLEVSADGNKLTKTAATGGFGGGVWIRQIPTPTAGASASP